MESLHKQVLPFMLRRMKEDVLQDLPPKIIQDYYCTLSALQVSVRPSQEYFGDMSVTMRCYFMILMQFLHSIL